MESTNRIKELEDVYRTSGLDLAKECATLALELAKTISLIEATKKLLGDYELPEYLK